MVEELEQLAQREESTWRSGLVRIWRLGTHLRLSLHLVA